jgi:hypothetical protein
VVKIQHGPVLPAHARIEGDDFSFPLGVEEIPIGCQFLGVDQVRIDADLDAPAVTDKCQDVSFFGIDVAQFALPPFRAIDNLRQR